MIIGALGDIIIFILLFPVDNTCKIKDHDTEVGFYHS